jgi:N-methylhydantoinase B
MGANNNQNGENAVHSHMTNTLNTPIEALEYSYPFLVTEYSIRKNSGGDGLYKGGNGIVRELKLLSDAEVTILSERRVFPPYGAKGGETGKQGKNLKISEGKEILLPGKFNTRFKKGDILRIETPGGGGYGKK